MKLVFSIYILLALLLAPAPAHSQSEDSPPLQAEAGDSRQTLVGRPVSFDISRSTVPLDTQLNEVTWDFGDGVTTTGQRVTHIYTRPGKFSLKLTLKTDQDSSQDTTEIQVFGHATLLIADPSAPEDQVELQQQQASKAGVLLIVLRAKGGGPEVLIEEELTSQLIDVRDILTEVDILVVWTSGSVGANVLSKFSQHIKQAEELALPDLDLANKGVIMISDTPLALLAPTAQAAFDQLQPAYILLTRPQALELLAEPLTAQQAQDVIFSSPIEHRLLGRFSARTVKDINLTNFFSFGINFLVNRGIPINSITLVLMLPVIATILSFSRQVIGIKAFGIITPAMAALSFLVMGLQYGLIVFAAVLISGTATRLLVRRLHLLYLPRMALVLTSVSLAILLLFGLGVASDTTTAVSFSIFPVLILTLLAEEFIAVQFSSGAKQAFTITAWTLILAIACYYIVSWELLRTLILSYPETILLAIPFNIIIGRFTGLRLTEYFRFRKLLRPTA